jgi:hypothetical protein
MGIAIIILGSLIIVNTHVSSFLMQETPVYLAERLN